MTSFCSAMCFCIAPAYAEIAYYQKIAGWTVVSGKETCGMVAEFEGKGTTYFTFVMNLDGTSALVLENSRWTIENEHKYEILYELNGSSYEGASSVGISGIGKRPGFVTKFDKNFVDDLAAGSSLSITMGEALVDKLSLDGTSAAISSVRKCLQKVQEDVDAIEAERLRWAHIADDPFGDQKKEQQKNQPPRPKHNAGSWATINDYPSRALHENREGIVEFDVQVGIDGRAIDCSIIASSGHEDLDQATCSNVMRRARFEPATDDKAQPIVGHYRNRITWRVPKE